MRDTILFLCVANSARSQMAEAIGRSLAPDGTVVMSAGSAPARVNPFATEALAEIGLSTEDHHSKSVQDIPLERVKAVITLCAEEVCPVFPASEGGEEIVKLHWPHEDPAPPDGVARSDEEIRASFARVRDQIRDRLQTYFAEVD